MELTVGLQLGGTCVNTSSACAAHHRAGGRGYGAIVTEKVREVHGRTHDQQVSPRGLWWASVQVGIFTLTACTHLQNRQMALHA